VIVGRERTKADTEKREERERLTNTIDFVSEVSGKILRGDSGEASDGKVWYEAEQ
jgi:hypothetical protein